MSSFESITVETVVDAPVEKVWDYWTKPEHIPEWDRGSDDWHTTHAENDLRVGGKFISRMEAVDGSEGFDFGGTYDVVDKHERIAYTMGDERKVDTIFENQGNSTKITQTLDAETINTLEIQREGWQRILDNFKKYVEEQTH